MDNVVFYGVGVVCLSVCADKDVTTDEVVQQANDQHDGGLGLRWHLSKDTTFSTGQPNSCPCDTYPNRVHYLLSC